MWQTQWLRMHEGAPDWSQYRQLNFPQYVSAWSPAEREVCLALQRELVTLIICLRLDAVARMNVPD